MVFLYYYIVVKTVLYTNETFILSYNILYLGQERRKSASEEIKAILSGKTSIKKIISNYLILTRVVIKSRGPGSFPGY